MLIVVYRHLYTVAWPTGLGIAPLQDPVGVTAPNWEGTYYAYRSYILYL